MILGIDASTKKSSVAVGNDNAVLAEISAEAKLMHSETLAYNIDFALKIAGASKTELTGIAVNLGPGSFTGLRVALATAKAMAYALELPLVGVSAMQVLAREFWGASATVYSLVDAQKNSAYVEGFNFDGREFVSVVPISIAPIKEFIAALPKEEKIILTGDAAMKYLKGKELSDNVNVAPTEKSYPRAANVVALGKERLARGESDDVMSLEPMYLRRSEAEILWERRYG